MLPTMGSGVGPGGRRAYFLRGWTAIARERSVTAATQSHIVAVKRDIVEGISIECWEIT